MFLSAAEAPRSEREFESIYYNAVNGLESQYKLLLAAVRPGDDIVTVQDKARLLAHYIDRRYVLRAISGDHVDDQHLFEELSSPVAKIPLLSPAPSSSVAIGRQARRGVQDGPDRLRGAVELGALQVGGGQVETSQRQLTESLFAGGCRLVEAEALVRSGDLGAARDLLPRRASVLAGARYRRRTRATTKTDTAQLSGLGPGPTDAVHWPVEN